MIPYITRRRLEQDDGEHEFHALNTLLLVVVLGLCILSAYLIKKYRFYFMPESSAALCVGLVVGGIARLITHSDEELNFLSFQPELFFFMLLPPIIFEAGYTLRRKNFFRNLGTITAFAVVGTLISTFVVGYLTFACGKAGLINIDGKNPMEALLFGALISAVDPVATLSIMGSPELNCDPLLYSLVFGESVLNDAVGIVLFKTFSKRVGATSSSLVAFIISVLDFIVIFGGSMVLGAALAACCALLLRLLRAPRGASAGAQGAAARLQVCVLAIFVFAPAFVAELVEMSGIVTTLFAAMAARHWGRPNVGSDGRAAADSFIATLAHLADTSVFLYLGLSLPFANWSRDAAPSLVAVSLLACLAGRACHVYPIALVANANGRGGGDAIPENFQHMLWFSGLRGAVAFSCAHTFPNDNGHRQGRKRVRNSQLQRLLSRSFSTRFG